MRTPQALQSKRVIKRVQNYRQAACFLNYFVETFCNSCAAAG
jgi:hypothetical protein